MNKDRVPDLLIEQLLLGELPEEKARELSRDPFVCARLSELEASNREILRRYPPEIMAKRIGWRMEKAAPERRFWTLPRLLPAVGFAALLAVAGALLATLGPSVLKPGEATEVTRVKGLKPHLVIYRKTDSGAEALEAGGEARPGDVLRIGYVSASRPYGIIFSIDGRGALTLHFPASPAVSNRLEGEGEVLLDYAYRLDDAPNFERFFLVTSGREFAVEKVLEKARVLAAQPQRARKGSLDLEAGLEQWSVLLVKK